MGVAPSDLSQKLEDISQKLEIFSQKLEEAEERRAQDIQAVIQKLSNTEKQLMKQLSDIHPPLPSSHPTIQLRFSDSSRFRDENPDLIKSSQMWKVQRLYAHFVREKDTGTPPSGEPVDIDCGSFKQGENRIAHGFLVQQNNDVFLVFNCQTFLNHYNYDGLVSFLTQSVAEGQYHVSKIDIHDLKVEYKNENSWMSLDIEEGAAWLEFDLAVAKLKSAPSVNRVLPVAVDSLKNPETSESALVVAPLFDSVLRGNIIESSIFASGGTQRVVQVLKDMPSGQLMSADQIRDKVKGTDVVDSKKLPVFATSNLQGEHGYSGCAVLNGPENGVKIVGMVLGIGIRPTDLPVSDCDDTSSHASHPLRISATQRHVMLKAGYISEAIQQWAAITIQYD